MHELDDEILTSAVARRAFDSTILRSTVITCREELEPYASEWNMLLSASRANTIFLTWEWISTWLETVYPDARLFVVTVRDRDSRLMAVAPFYLSDLSLLSLVKYKCLRVIGDCQSGGEYGDVIVRRGFEEAALTCVIQELAEHDIWDCIWLCNASGWTGTRETFSTVCRGLGLYIHEWLCKFSSVRLPCTHEAYLQQLSKKRRGYIKRETRRLQESHSVELVRCDSQDRVPESLEHLFGLHRKHWESDGEPGSFVRRPLMRQFYESFAPISLDAGWLRIYVLRVDGVPQAAQYGYVYDGTYYAVQEGYNPGSFDGIGNILRNLVIERCIEERLREYDFLGGFTEHKRLWGAEARNGYDLLIGRQSLKNRLLFFRDISPKGRFIRQGRPANEGCSDS